MFWPILRFYLAFFDPTAFNKTYQSIFGLDTSVNSKKCWTINTSLAVCNVKHRRESSLTFSFLLFSLYTPSSSTSATPLVVTRREKSSKGEHHKRFTLLVTLAEKTRVSGFFIGFSFFFRRLCS
ncbi:unnamed protein product [Brassica rapa subsp. narinosa]